MRSLRKALFYVSVGLDWLAHLIRYWGKRTFGDAKDVAGVRVVLVRDGKVVLVKHWYAPGVWTLPGGGLMKGERATDGAVREILEETGYTIKSFCGEVGIYQGRRGRGDSVIVLCSEDFEGSMKFLPNLEIMERSFFDLRHLPYNLSPANRRRVESYIKGVRNERGYW